MSEKRLGATVSVEQQGATIQSVYIARKSNVYALYDSEVEHLSGIDAQTTAAYSIMSFLAALAFGIWTNAAFAEKFTAEGALLTKFIAPLFLIFSGGLLLWARNLGKRRKAYWDNIRAQTHVSDRL